MQSAHSASVQVWIVLSADSAMHCRAERHRLVERIVSLAMPQSRPTSISWATSVDALALAVSSGPSVGIDLERPLVRRAGARYIAALASSSLSSAEARAFERVVAAEQANWLLHRWTAKEAHLKRIGAGLCVAPSTIEIDWPGPYRMPGVARSVGVHGGADHSGRISHLRSFMDARAGFICSLACERPLDDREVAFRCVVGMELPFSPAC